MIQLPPVPPDPNLIIMNLIPIAGMATGVIRTRISEVGPVGRAIGDIIRHLFGTRTGKSDPALGGEVDELRTRLDAMQQHLAELAERQDFSERMLAQVRKDRALPGGTDVAG